MESQYHRELEVALGAVETAARISRVALSTAQIDDTAGSFDVVKDDLSPVTIADFAIQALLTRTLGAAFPGDAFVGEESADELRQNPSLLSRVLAIVAQCAGNSLFRDTDDLCDVIDSCATATIATSPGARTWVFDPIDGTKTFIRREQYAINVALLEEGKQVLSVVGLPLLAADATPPVTDASVDPTGTGCILYAVRGHGTYVRPLLVKPGEVAQPRRIPRHADKVTSLDGLRCVTCWVHLDSGVDTVHKGVAEQLGVPFPGSDLLGWVPRWAAMALGLANMTVWVYKKRDRRAKIWDHAGAMLLFEEVGGLVTDVHGKPIDLTSGRKFEENFGFVAAPESMHHVVLKTVLDTLKAQGRKELLS